MRLQFTAALAIAMFAAIPSGADDRLMRSGRSVVDQVIQSFDGCYLSLREFESTYSAGSVEETQKKANAIYACIESEPKKIKPVVDRFRIIIAGKPAIVKQFDNFIMMYRRCLGILGTPGVTSRQMDIYASQLSGKGAELVAHLE